MQMLTTIHDVCLPYYLMVTPHDTTDFSDHADHLAALEISISNMIQYAL